MEREPRAFLWDALEAATAVTEFVAGRSLESYRTDRLLRSAVERQCEIVGEALAGLARFAPAIAARVADLRLAIAFRNRLIHGYASVDDGVVWRVATEDMPRLAAALAALLRDLEPGG